MERFTKSFYRIDGRLFFLARVAWLVVTLFSLIVFVATIAGMFWGAQQRPLEFVTGEYEWSAAVRAQTLVQLDFPIEALAFYTFLVGLITPLGFVAVGLYLFLRKPGK